MRILREIWFRLMYAARFLIRGNDIPDATSVNPVLEARLKGQGSQYFIIKATWDSEDQTWLVEMPEIHTGILTNHDTLPGALFMAGDAAMGILEHLMKYDLYPPKRDNTWVFDAKQGSIPDAFRREWDNPDMDAYNDM